MRTLKYLLHAAVVVGLLIAGVKYINGDEFWAAVHRFNWIYVPFILACAASYLAFKTLRFAYLLRRLDGVPVGTAMRAYLAGQAAVVLPAGIAARAGLLQQAGVPLAASGPSILLSSAADWALLLLCSLVAAIWFEPARTPVLLLLTALILGSILLGIHAVRSWLLGLAEGLMGRLRLLEQWRGMLEAAPGLLSLRVLGITMGLTVVAFAFLFYALALSVYGVGAQVPLLSLLLALALPALLGRMSALPGGIGVTEAGMVGILNAAVGVSLDQAAAAVTIYRLGTIFFMALVGGVVYLAAWRGSREPRGRPADGVRAGQGGT